MNIKVRSMLERMYEIINSKYPDPLKSWDCLIEFLAADNCGSLFLEMEDNLKWLSEDNNISDVLIDIYDSELLKSDYYDHLGEMYFELFSAKNDNSLISMNKARLEAENNIDQTKEKQLILDTDVKSGRFLMNAYKINTNAILCGVEIDLRLFRIALTNCVIHNIPVYLLHADSDEHNIDISTADGMNNWQYANKWNSCTDKLKVISGGKH